MKITQSFDKSHDKSQAAVVGLVFSVALLFTSACSTVGSGTHPTFSVATTPEDAKNIKATLFEHKAAFEKCYVDTLKKMKEPYPEGMVRARFEIDEMGQVATTEIVQSDLKLPTAEACILEALKKITFPQPSSMKPIRASFPFKFKVK